MSEQGTSLKDLQTQVLDITDMIAAKIRGQEFALGLPRHSLRLKSLVWSEDYTTVEVHTELDPERVSFAPRALFLDAVADRIKMTAAGTISRTQLALVAMGVLYEFDRVMAGISAPDVSERLGKILVGIEREAGR